MPEYQGFILQATYRIHQGVPVVFIYGRLQDNSTFTIRDNTQRPHFYVANEHAHAVVNAKVSASHKVGFAGEGLSRVEVKVPSDAPTVRDALHNIGIETYEADVRFAMRYLIDRDIKGGIGIRGVAQPGKGTRWVFDNPEVFPVQLTASPKILSFDIETNPEADKLLAIACYSTDFDEVVDEVVVVDPGDRCMPNQAVGVGSEKEALHYFAQLVQRLDVDILTGWNVIDFDLVMLNKVAERVRYDLQLGRDQGQMRIRPAQGYFGSGHANIPGRVVLDGIDLVRGAFIRMDEYSLDAVAQQVLGEGKTLVGKGEDKVKQILDTYADDLPAFTAYARTDARLALEIVQKLDLVNLAFARSGLTGMPPDRVAASIASFDFLYLSALHKRGVAAPSVKKPGQSKIAQGGGAVFEPTVGIHHNVWVCDYRSLYPSIIRTFNIDPLGYEQGQGDGDAIRTYDDTCFARALGILPKMLDNLFPQRAQAKARGDETASQAIKILMNSFYGVLGTPACRFYNPHIANAITSQGRYLLGWSKQWFESRGYTVLYGDTDSVFVASGIEDAEQAQSVAQTLVVEFNQQLRDHLQRTAGVESRLELEFEKLYTKLFLAKTRGGSQGARKRYAGQRLGSDSLEFVGMEVVRRDWTDLAKEVQRNLFVRLFQGDEVADYLHNIVVQLRQGALDNLLVYRKGLRKDVATYTTHVPPHVQAVKKSNMPPPRVVHYIVTDAGPELVGQTSGPPNREHYLEKQIKPVAEPVLEALGLDFDQVIGDDRQISLF